MLSTTTEGDRLLTPRETAELIGVEVGTLGNWRSRGAHDLPFVKSGGRLVRYRLADVRAWIDRKTHGAISK